jgi:hypothetical protein
MLPYTLTCPGLDCWRQLEPAAFAPAYSTVASRELVILAGLNRNVSSLGTKTSSRIRWGALPLLAWTVWPLLRVRY